MTRDRSPAQVRGRFSDPILLPSSGQAPSVLGWIQACTSRDDMVVRDRERVLQAKLGATRTCDGDGLLDQKRPKATRLITDQN
jgi:hypothetical protein